MATKAKESSVVGKEKKAESSTSPITSTKRTTKPSTTRSSTDKATSSNPSDKQIPNYLKPTISSRLIDSHSFKLPKSDAPNKPTLNRRRSFDKPPSPSRLPKQKQPSPSRQHKALVSPGPRERSLSLPLRTSSVAVKSTNNPSKPISQRISKTPKEGKTQPLIATKRSPSPSTSSTKKVANDASPNSTNAAKSTTAETTEVLSVETEVGVKEAINEKVEVEEVVKVENQEQEVENNASEIPPHVESEHEHEHDHDHEVEESDDQPHIQADDEKVIPTVSEQEAAAKEEKIEYTHEEDENINQDECNINESHPEMNHSTTEEEVEVKEKEEGGGLDEDHKSEKNNIEEEAVEEKEGVEGGISEGVKLTEGEDEDEHVESQLKEEEVKEESTKPKQQASAGHRKKESQVSNDVIEETAGKLLEARKNKVKALAGAFQTVIDYQTK